MSNQAIQKYLEAYIKSGTFFWESKKYNIGQRVLIIESYEDEALKGNYGTIVAIKRSDVRDGLLYGVMFDRDECIGHELTVVLGSYIISPASEHLNGWWFQESELKAIDNE